MTDQCGSGFCVDGVCCDSACGGGLATDCQACNLTGSLGSCGAVSDGTSCAGGACGSGECIPSKPDGGSPLTVPSGGCGCTSSSGTSLESLLLLGLLLLVRRRRVG